MFPLNVLLSRFSQYQNNFNADNHTYMVNGQERCQNDHVKILMSPPHPIWLGANLKDFATLPNTSYIRMFQTFQLMFCSNWLWCAIRIHDRMRKANAYTHFLHRKRWNAGLNKLNCERTHYAYCIDKCARAYAALPWNLKHEFPSYCNYTY